jgi:C-terminal processing protease CtpA/Prc
LITGTIPYTSPFFKETLSGGYVLLEDQAGFVVRDENFIFPLESQIIGPVELIEEGLLSYRLTLPSIPQATLLDVDNNLTADKGVMIFQIAYASNTWGNPFLEKRDATGWSVVYSSITADPERDYEIDGGHLIIWAPDDKQGFPSSFGSDGMLFTEDDPVQTVPAGYSIVSLDQTPFRVYKEANPSFTLTEGELAVKDFSDMDFTTAFNALITRVSIEYPFTIEKNIDWDALHTKYAARVSQATSNQEFYRIMLDFSHEIPDAHVGISFDAQVFYEEAGGSFGMILTELSDGSVIVTDVLAGYPASTAGILSGAQIITWDNKPVYEALNEVEPFTAPYSTAHHKRQEQLIFLTRYPIGTLVSVTFKNPGADLQEVELKAEHDYDSLFAALPYLSFDEMVLPVEAEILDESGFGYIQITSFADDFVLSGGLWDRFLQNLNEYDIPGLIIDMRINSGGSLGLALNYAGYFFQEEFEVYISSYYNERLGEWEYDDHPTKIEPGPVYYDGKVAVLIGPDCISACEVFSAMLATNDRSIIVGHFPTAGAFGEVGRGQYEIPGGYSMQFPTGRPETLDGDLFLEGTGVIPDIEVPITYESALGASDAVLEAAIQALLVELE